MHFDAALKKVRTDRVVKGLADLRDKIEKVGWTDEARAASLASRQHYDHVKSHTAQGKAAAGRGDMKTAQAHAAAANDHETAGQEYQEAGEHYKAGHQAAGDKKMDVADRQAVKANAATGKLRQSRR